MAPVVKFELGTSLGHCGVAGYIAFAKLQPFFVIPRTGIGGSLDGLGFCIVHPWNGFRILAGDLEEPGFKGPWQLPSTVAASRQSAALPEAKGQVSGSLPRRRYEALKSAQSEGTAL